MSMQRRPRDYTDYLWVVTQQMNRAAELLTQYFNDASDKPARYRMRQAVGAVLVLYSITLPVIEEKGKVDVTSLKSNYAELAAALRDGSPGRAVKVALQALEEIIRALYISELLYRESASIPIV